MTPTAHEVVAGLLVDDEHLVLHRRSDSADRGVRGFLGRLRVLLVRGACCCAGTSYPPPREGSERSCPDPEPAPPKAVPAACSPRAGGRQRRCRGPHPMRRACPPRRRRAGTLCPPTCRWGGRRARRPGRRTACARRRPPCLRRSRLRPRRWPTHLPDGCRPWPRRRPRYRRRAARLRAARLRPPMRRIVAGGGRIVRGLVPDGWCWGARPSPEPVPRPAQGPRRERGRSSARDPVAPAPTAVGVLGGIGIGARTLRHRRRGSPRRRCPSLGLRCGRNRPAFDGGGVIGRRGPYPGPVLLGRCGWPVRALSTPADDAPGRCSRRAPSQRARPPLVVRRCRC